jgi:chemotaxis protein MotB
MNRSHFSRIPMVAVLAAIPFGCSQKAAPIAQPVQEMSSPRPTSDLERQLNEAMAASARDKDRIAALESEASALRQKLAQRPAPAPAPAPGWSSVPGGAMTSIEGTILFDAGKAALKPDAKDTLASVVSVVQSKFPGYDIYVFGHTDDTPIKKSGWKDNYELSAQRALSVVRMLRSMDVENKMAAAGWGEQLPAESGRSSAARQQNRRVEIYAMAPAKGGRAETSPPSGAGRGSEQPSARAARSATR